MENTPSSTHSQLYEVITLFLRLGLTAFGGPAAHIAMMHEEVVKRRKWVDEQVFLDLLGAANLIPGPTSTELAIYLAYRRTGWVGLLLGGICFILPAMLIVMALAWVYVTFGSTPWVLGALYGVLPVVIVIVSQALWGLGRKAVKNWLTGITGILVVFLYMAGGNILLLLVAAGAIVMMVENRSKIKQIQLKSVFFPLAGLSLATVVVPFSLPILFLTFLRIGSVLYGSGYVLLAFLHADFVNHLGWLTDRQLIDAIAIGQVTPGPVFTTATFIGYILGGIPGAILATAGIFLPSFVFVAISSFVVPKIRSSIWTATFLDGVNVASLGLMLGVMLQLSVTAIKDPITMAIALISFLLLFRYSINSTWLIAGGALIGLLHEVLLR
jgi:chromate transporter